jgi:glycosyltransferase involved in cell wall biosynthesis
MKKIRVLMLGPSLYQQGGMATVENLIVDYPSDLVDIQHISTHEEGSILRRIQIFISGFWYFCGKLIFDRIDVIHLHASERGSVFRMGLLVLVGNLFSKPVILHTHGCEFHLFYEKMPCFGQAIVRLIFQRSTYVIALSQSWKNYYTNHCHLDPQKVLVMLNPVQVPGQIPARSLAPRLIGLFLGRIGQRKGAFDTIQAVAQLSQSDRDRIQILMAGDGEIEKAQALIQQLGLENTVQLLGWIDPKTRDELLSRAHVFLLPSYNEGLPVSMVEAMAWGLPVIVTPVGGIPELVTDQKHGFLVNPGDITGIAQALQTLIREPHSRLVMGTAARQQVSQLDVAQYHQTLAQVYGATVNRSRDYRPRTSQLSREKAL